MQSRGPDLGSDSIRAVHGLRAYSLGAYGPQAMFWNLIELLSTPWIGARCQSAPWIGEAS